jgi:biopolymer transport protein ExbD
MAEIAGGDGGGGKHDKKRAKKPPAKIDMTPMVDLAFLLLTFFILTSTFNKPKTMEITFPVPPDDITKQPPIKNGVTLLLTKNDKIFFYKGEYRAEPKDGNPATTLTEYNFSTNPNDEKGIHKLFMQLNAGVYTDVQKLQEEYKKSNMADTTFKSKLIAIKGTKEAVTVLIKTDDKATYKNVVDVLDELNITQIGKYAIVDILKSELELLTKANPN